MYQNPRDRHPTPPNHRTPDLINQPNQPLNTVTSPNVYAWGITSLQQFRTNTAASPTITVRNLFAQSYEFKSAGAA